MNNITIRMDLGDKKNTICILNELGKVVNETTVANTSNDLKTFFSKYKGATIAPSVSM